MSEATPLTPRETVESVAKELAITMTSSFVPWSQSRNKNEKTPSLNWVVRLHKGNLPKERCLACRGMVFVNGVECLHIPPPFIETDYMAGMAHCPSYKIKDRYEQQQMVARECETGRACRFMANMAVTSPSRRDIVPELASVLSCLCSDSDAIDYATFEEWAQSMGADPDSRKAEATYRACLETALKMRSGLGDEGFRRLREACQGY